ncbi:MAG: UDP-N-acetylmuramate--L-alanine ligase [Clostridia bacterium]|nr:UDP-N-acetylmuramate--L-alanine ligase [Clostridia bacterium]
MSERIHFIGIGGISMSTLAMMALKRGDTVTGSDREKSPLTDALEKNGATVFCPQSEGNVGRADRVVYTAAIAEDNPEYIEATRKCLPMLRRSAYLGELMKDYEVRIGVSGTHGKSSTTGMLSSIFTQAGVDPTTACGAVLSDLGSAFRLGGKKHFIYEACEYKDSFLDFFPTVSLILNIEMDHTDYFKDLAQMKTSYLRSVEKAKAVVVNGDDKNALDVAGEIRGAWVVKAGVTGKDLDFSAAAIERKGGYCSFDLMKENAKLGRVVLRVPGDHHVGNAVCAAAAAYVCGVDPDDIVKGLSSFGGVDRRFQFLGTYRGARCFDDYAHHPTEIRATFRTARALLEDGPGRLFCVFQPHTFSRTHEFHADFVKELAGADKLYLAPIYPAREEKDLGESSEQIAREIPGAVALPDFDAIAALLEKELSEGDLLLTMGAGYAYKAARALLEKG